MRKILVALLAALLLPSLASAQLNPHPFRAFYGGTITAPIIGVAGTAAAPAYAFTGATNFGFRYSGSTVIVVINGTDTHFFTGSNFQIRSNSGAVYFGTGLDAAIGREAADSFQLGADAATAAAQTISAADSTGAGIAGAQLNLSGGTGGAAGEPGAVAIVDGGTKPTCAAGIRGSIWYDAGGAGVADTFEVCAKQAAGDTYAWRVLATIP